MKAPLPRARGVSRRAFVTGLASLPALGSAGKGRILPPDRVRYTDPATEFTLVRLTNPGYASYLPPTTNACISRRGDFLIFASERDGSLQAFRMEHKSGEWRQLTEASNLDRTSLLLAPDQRSVYFADGANVIALRLPGFRERVVYRTPPDWTRTPGLAMTVDGLYLLQSECSGSKSRLRLISTARSSATTLVETEGEIESILPRPGRAAVSYRRRGDDSLWLVDFGGKQNYRLQLNPGKVLAATWARDGRSLFYLQAPAEPGKLITLREFNPDTRSDALIGPTSQFVSFSRNADASVFVGACGSKASPHVLLFLRSNKREFTLCEHRASDPSQVMPVFDPSSERVYFQSDRDGKPAIYAIDVDRLVEKTEA
jgi:Periplasmic component of the Tol biopolymer transport system